MIEIKVKLKPVNSKSEKTDDFLFYLSSFYFN